MEETKHYDVFVIGTGIAGQTAAEVCVKNNLKVGIADNRAFGGTCAIRGCDPKKILLQFTELIHKSQLLIGDGVSKLPKIKWKEVQKFKSSFTDAIPLSTEKKLSNLGIEYYHQSPIFQNDNQVLVEGKLISANTFVIATGMIPRPLKITGNEFLGISDDILNLKKLPKTVTFIGSGYVGMEFACMMATMGSKVTMIEHGSKPLKQFDAFLVDKLVTHLETMGIRFIFNAEVTSVEKLKKNLKVNYLLDGKEKSIKSSKVFNTAGRVPSIELLELEKAHVKFDKSGVLVDDFLQSVSNPHIYACGDVSSKSLPLTPLSGLQGYVVGNNILKANSKKFDVPCIPSTVFTNPKLSSVGYSEEEAQKRFKNIKIYQGDASAWYNAKKENNPVYAYKILVNERTNVIVGAHLLSSEANETINVFSMAIQQKMTVLQFKKQMFTYPSYSSDLKSMLKDTD
ncbi:NAD(P)/FAD-dependent oxidoreductase [Mariniflexile litorale]|uniref:NAD(P)/FAD-dependent oxidoreductase n=1 Tax=Mariniflexile litorale TaxID=3045158 RepID=A0AAU7ELF3_9FLAO|nr:NAD(P)/FAD-dependent oxidoreductase [Mariniflexile sp. KMM 9835]MDQ8211244.1 NAD(P)/FAD-dependent oxidoreductase [Mariniflexile sp. KMM 9835]